MPVYQYVIEKPRLQTRIYVWGFAQFGALGMSNYVKPRDGKRPLVKQHRPARLDFAEKHEVTDVACGYGFTVFAVKSTNLTKVFGTGLNSDSQIGYHAPVRGHPLEFIIEPAPIEIPFNSSSTKVTQVACGRAHSIILTDKEGIFSLGNNAYGQCGRPIVQDEEYKANPRIHKVHIDESIAHIECGQDNTLFITDKGQVYSCGWGADGQLGIGTFKNEWHPQLVNGDIKNEKIIKVSCTADCILALSDKGHVFGWGNSEYGQLLDAAINQQLNIPRLIPLEKCGKIVDIVAAGTMCAVLNSSGQVYVWGFGLLGKGPALQNSNIPSPIPKTLFGCNEFSPDLKVTELACGLNHLAAITNEGNLFMWGRNKMACLGLGNGEDQFFPLRVSVPAKVKKVACGVDHTVTLCKSLA